MIFLWLLLLFVFFLFLLSFPVSFKHQKNLERKITSRKWRGGITTRKKEKLLDRQPPSPPSFNNKIKGSLVWNILLVIIIIIIMIISFWNEREKTWKIAFNLNWLSRDRHTNWPPTYWIFLIYTPYTDGRPYESNGTLVLPDSAFFDSNGADRASARARAPIQFTCRLF